MHLVADCTPLGANGKIAARLASEAKVGEVLASVQAHSAAEVNSNGN